MTIMQQMMIMLIITTIVITFFMTTFILCLMALHLKDNICICVSISVRSSSPWNPYTLFVDLISMFEPPADVLEIERHLKESDVTGPVYHKELFLSLMELKGMFVYKRKVKPNYLSFKELLFDSGLHSEQLALVDMLVLLKASKVVGDTRSSFSAFIKEYRHLVGYSNETFRSVENGNFNFFVFTP